MVRDPKVIARRIELLDLLVLHENTGLTPSQICEIKGWTPPIVAYTVQSLRDWLGENGDNTFTLPCAPDVDVEGGLQGEWPLRLVRVDAPETSKSGKALKFWVGWMFDHIIRRLQTLRSQMAVVVRCTDGRTTRGRKARVVYMHLSHAFDNLELIDAEENGGGAAVSNSS